MQRLGMTGLGMAMLALCAGVADARPARPGLPVPQATQPRPRLVIVEGDGGFVIRCEYPKHSRDPAFPPGAIPLSSVPLGASVRIDRAALQNSNHKDISHGETR